MKISVRLLLWLKLIDIMLQAVCFVVFMCGLSQIGNSAFTFIEAPFQMFSCATWWALRPSILPNLGRRAVQRTFLMVTAVGVCCLIFMPLLYSYLMAMLFIGPFCGLWYFIVTCREAYHLKQETYRPHMFI